LFAYCAILGQLLACGFVPVSGSDKCVLDNFSRWKQHTILAAAAPDPQLPACKTFKPKFDLPILADYSKPAPPEFWERFPQNFDTTIPKIIDPDKLLQLANVAGVADSALCAQVINNIRNGAEIGCKGKFRRPTRSTNAPSALEYPAEVTDAVAGWVSKKFAFGPVPANRVPADAKVNGIMCRPKPNGSARVILNLSAPKNKSVNDGIDATDFPATMGSTGRWIRILHAAGRNCLFCKLDWADAYKHIPVSPNDLHLQWFEWLGMFFVELCLVFGCAASAGLFDAAAKLFLMIVLALAQFPANMVCQYLDDVCAAAPAGSTALDHFERVYREAAEFVGIRLAPVDDPEKAFRPTTAGVVLGVFYNSVDWTWHIPEEKLARFLSQLRAAASAESVEFKEFVSLAGRVLHYAPLIPASRFHLIYIIKAKAIAANTGADRVLIFSELSDQLWFWHTILKVTAGAATIPRPVSSPPAWALQAYTDAAGGSQINPGAGCGGVVLSHWIWVTWPRRINIGVRFKDGKQLSKKMSAWELFAPLALIASNLDLFRNRPAQIWVDNAGSVRIWAKGYSTRCTLCTTLVQAINDVVAAIGCTLYITKIRRCSAVGAVLADHLSQSELSAFKAAADRAAWPLDNCPARVPLAALRWLRRPCKDDFLGQRILAELASQKPIIGYSV